MSEQDTRIESTVKTFCPTRGYGWIKDPNDFSRDYYFHHTRLLMGGYRVVQPGQRVRFRPEVTERSKDAWDVEPLP